MKNKKEEFEYVRDLLHSIIQFQQDEWNNRDKDHTVSYDLTLTNHKVEAKPDQLKNNQDIAYLRLSRTIRPIANQGEEDNLLLHQEIHTFSSTKERLDPEAPWKLGMYINLLAKCIIGGLLYEEAKEEMKRIKKRIGDDTEDSRTR